MPGLLSKISISNPESSARQIRFVFFEKNFDLIIEFCAKVFPFSTGLLMLKSIMDCVLIPFGSNALIS